MTPFTYALATQLPDRIPGHRSDEVANHGGTLRAERVVGTHVERPAPQGRHGPHDAGSVQRGGPRQADPEAGLGLSGNELEDAVALMRRTGAHVARVFDAHGTTTGVLFLEDIIEELVGEVQDAISA